MSATKLFILVSLISLIVAGCGSPEDRAADYQEKAQALFDEGELVTARIEALNAAQIQPRNADVRYLLAQIEEQEGDFQKAIGHLMVAIDADPDHFESLIKLGGYYILGRAPDEAAKQAEAALKLRPDDAGAHLLNARVAFLKEDTELAFSNVETALEIDPTIADAIMFKAGLLMSEKKESDAMNLINESLESATSENAKQLRQFRILLLRSVGKNEEVEEDLRALVRDFPDDETFPLALAQIYLGQGKTKEAEDIFRTHVARDPEDPKRRIEFARFVGSQRGIEAAEETLKEFIAEIPESAELRLGLGNLYESNDQPDEARATYEQIVAKEPTSDFGLAARNRLAAIQLRGNDTDSARKTIDAILIDAPDNASALMYKAAFNFNDKNYDQAIANLRNVVRTNPESERALLLLARSHRAANSPELAQDAYRRLLDVNPGNSDGATELADLLARGGDVESAEEVLRKQLEAVPEDRRAASTLVEALLLQGNFEDAEAKARELLLGADETGLAEFQLGRVLQAQESNAEAITAYKQALLKNPTAPEPLQGLITVLVRDGQQAEAVDYLQDHLREFPSASPARLLLAAVHVNRREIDEAAAQYEEIISQNPGATRAYASLASLYPEDAGKRKFIYNRGIRANPDDVPMKLLLAGEYEKESNFTDAMSIYEAILEKNPENDLAANNLASLLLDYGKGGADITRALELSERFAESNQPAVLDTLGWAYYKNGNLENAVRYLEKAVESAGGVPILRYHLGMALFKSGNNARAKSELEKALEGGEFLGREEAQQALDSLGG